MRSYFISVAGIVATAALSACSGGASVLAPASTAPPSSATATAKPTAVATATPAATATPVGTAPTATPTPATTAQPQVVHIGFNHTTTDDPTFGDVSYYTNTPGADDPAAVVHVAAGSSIVFTSDSGQPDHTASGLGSSGFPTSFDNTGGTTATGSTINGGTSWSTGTLAGGSSSAVFTVGPAGDYYFGCFYHYNDASMRDVIVSQ